MKAYRLAIIGSEARREAYSLRAGQAGMVARTDALYRSLLPIRLTNERNGGRQYGSVRISTTDPGDFDGQVILFPSHFI